MNDKPDRSDGGTGDGRPAVSWHGPATGGTAMPGPADGVGHIADISLHSVPINGKAVAR